MYKFTLGEFGEQEMDTTSMGVILAIFAQIPDWQNR